MKKLAIIGAGKMACIFAENAREMGVETHCFAWREGAVADKEVDFFYPISIFERDEILHKCKEIGIGGIVATTELTIATVAYIAEKLGLNGNELKIAEVITDKFRNREVSADVKGLNHPRYTVISSEEELINIRMEFPIILKPTNKGGKKGISVVHDAKDLQNAFKYAASEAGNSEKFIVEEYINGGQEFSVESLTYHGTNHIIQITEKISSGPPHCVELEHHQPGDLSFEQRTHIENVLKEALAKIGITNGACHTEIKVKEGKIYLIEFNARPGGDHIAYPLTNLSTGYEYIKGIIKVAFDELDEIDEKKFENNYAGVLFVTEQTKHLKPLFDNCQNFEWCYKKNEVSKDLTALLHNDGYNINYFIYFSKQERPEFKKIIENIVRTR